MDQETLSSQMEQDTSEQETIRREKLAQMRENGMDPYAHTTFPKHILAGRSLFITTNWQRKPYRWQAVS